MSKFAVPKETMVRLKIIYTDIGFHNRAIRRINTELEAVLAMEAKRTGNLGKKPINIDLDKNEITYEDIVKPTEKEKRKILKPNEANKVSKR